MHAVLLLLLMVAAELVLLWCTLQRFALCACLCGPDALDVLVSVCWMNLGVSGCVQMVCGVAPMQ